MRNSRYRDASAARSRTSVVGPSGGGGRMSATPRKPPGHTTTTDCLGKQDMPSARPGQPNTRREPFGMPALLASGCLLAALFAPANYARADETAAQATAAWGDAAAVPAAATGKPRRGKHGGRKDHGGGK